MLASLLGLFPRFLQPQASTALSNLSIQIDLCVCVCVCVCVFYACLLPAVCVLEEALDVLSEREASLGRVRAFSATCGVVQ